MQKDLIDIYRKYMDNIHTIEWEIKKITLDIGMCSELFISARGGNIYNSTFTWVVNTILRLYRIIVCKTKKSL